MRLGEMGNGFDRKSMIRWAFSISSSLRLILLCSFACFVADFCSLGSSGSMQRNHGSGFDFTVCSDGSVRLLLLKKILNSEL